MITLIIFVFSLSLFLSLSLSLKKMNTQDGLKICSRYAFMPNRLRYCGGDHNEDLFYLTSQKDTNPFLNELLREFETLYPYLQLIAKCNQISDPFDARVVEAYWLGNELLEQVDQKNLFNHFENNFKKKLAPNKFHALITEILPTDIPHHTFHVLKIWQQTGMADLPKVLETMDNCRVSWGQITKVLETELEVSTPALTLINEQLSLSEPILKKITFKLLGESFIANPQVNDWVSFHWNFACDKLTLQQVKNLKKYTILSLNNTK